MLAAELGEQGVRVNCVLPGAVPTEINERAGLGSKAELDARMRALEPLHALGRGEPSEVARRSHFCWTPTGSLVRCSMWMAAWVLG